MNVKINKEEGTITITLPLIESKLSGTGKTMIVAQAMGNMGTLHEGKDLFCSINVFTKIPKNLRQNTEE